MRNANLTKVFGVLLSILMIITALPLQTQAHRIPNSCPVEEISYQPARNNKSEYEFQSRPRRRLPRTEVVERRDERPVAEALNTGVRFLKNPDMKTFRGITTITPPDAFDIGRVVITYTPLGGGLPKTVEATKGDNGVWTLPRNIDRGINIDSRTGVITMPANLYVHRTLQATARSTGKERVDNNLNWDESPRKNGRNFWPLGTNTKGTKYKLDNDGGYPRRRDWVSDLTYDGDFVNENGETVIRIRWYFAWDLTPGVKREYALFHFDPELFNYIDFNKSYIVERGLEGQIGKTERKNQTRFSDGTQRYEKRALIDNVFKGASMAGQQADILLVLNTGTNMETLKQKNLDYLIQMRLLSTRYNTILANYGTGNEPQEQIPYSSYTMITSIPLAHNVIDEQPVQFKSVQGAIDSVVISRTSSEYIADRGVLTSKMQIFKPLWLDPNNWYGAMAGYREVVDEKFLSVLKPDSEGYVGRIYKVGDTNKAADNSGLPAPIKTDYYQNFKKSDFNIKDGKATLIFAPNGYNRLASKVVTVAEPFKVLYYKDADTLAGSTVIEYYIDPTKIDEYFASSQTKDNSYSFVQNTSIILNQPQDGFMPYYSYTTTRKEVIPPGKWTFEIPRHRTGSTNIYRPGTPEANTGFWVTIGDTWTKQIDLEQSATVGNWTSSSGHKYEHNVYSEHGMTIPAGTEIRMYYPASRVLDPSFRPTFDFAGKRFTLKRISNVNDGWFTDGYTGDFNMQKTRRIQAVELAGTQYKPYVDDIFTDSREFTGAVINRKFDMGSPEGMRQVDYYPGATIVADWKQGVGRNNEKEYREYTFPINDYVKVTSKGTEYRQSRPFTIKKTAAYNWDFKKDMKIDFRTSVAGQLPSEPTTKKVKAKVFFNQNYTGAPAPEFRIVPENEKAYGEVGYTPNGFNYGDVSSNEDINKMPENPTRPGYAFLGWSNKRNVTEEEFNKASVLSNVNQWRDGEIYKFTENSPIDEQQQVFAVWGEGSNITLRANNGTNETAMVRITKNVIENATRVNADGTNNPHGQYVLIPISTVPYTSNEKSINQADLKTFVKNGSAPEGEEKFKNRHTFIGWTKEADTNLNLRDSNVRGKSKSKEKSTYDAIKDGVYLQNGGSLIVPRDITKIQNVELYAQYRPYFKVSILKETINTVDATTRPTVQIGLWHRTAVSEINMPTVGKVSYMPLDREYGKDALKLYSNAWSGGLVESPSVFTWYVPGYDYKGMRFSYVGIEYPVGTNGSNYIRTMEENLEKYFHANTSWDDMKIKVESIDPSQGQRMQDGHAKSQTINISSTRNGNMVTDTYTGATVRTPIDQAGLNEEITKLNIDSQWNRFEENIERGAKDFDVYGYNIYMTNTRTDKYNPIVSKINDNDNSFVIKDVFKTTKRDKTKEILDTLQLELKLNDNTTKIYNFKYNKNSVDAGSVEDVFTMRKEKTLSLSSIYNKGIDDETSQDRLSEISIEHIVGTTDVKVKLNKNMAFKYNQDTNLNGYALAQLYFGVDNTSSDKRYVSRDVSHKVNNIVQDDTTYFNDDKTSDRKSYVVEMEIPEDLYRPQIGSKYEIYKLEDWDSASKDVRVNALPIGTKEIVDNREKYLKIEIPANEHFDDDTEYIIVAREKIGEDNGVTTYAEGTPSDPFTIDTKGPDIRKAEATDDRWRLVTTLETEIKNVVYPVFIKDDNETNPQVKEFKDPQGLGKWIEYQFNSKDFDPEKITLIAFDKFKNRVTTRFNYNPLPITKLSRSEVYAGDDSLYLWMEKGTKVEITVKSGAEEFKVEYEAPRDIKDNEFFEIELKKNNQTDQLYKLQVGDEISILGYTGARENMTSISVPELILVEEDW